MQPKPKLNVSLIKNEELRPWTVNPNLDERLKFEKDSLERTITYIAPNMSAGKLGSSILDGNVPGIQEFRTTIMKRTHDSPLITKLAPMDEFFPLYVTKANMSQRFHSNSTTKLPSGQSSRLHSKPPSSKHDVRYFLDTTVPDTNNKGFGLKVLDKTATWPGTLEVKTQFPEEDSMFGMDSLVGADDMKKIDSLQKELYKRSKSKRDNKDLTAIRSVKIGRCISPATVSMRFTEYHRLRDEMTKSNKNF